MDAAIGRILATLKSEGMERDTLVMFFCDNGSAKSSNAAVRAGAIKSRGGKGTLQEGGIRVPAVMRCQRPSGLVLRQINSWAFRTCYHWRPWRQFL